VTGYDIVAVGGGLGGAALAKAMAERGARVLVVERERQFRDRVRGEVMSPWGVAEARALGVCDLLSESCGHTLRFVDIYAGPALMVHRDVVETTPQRAPFLAFYHPAMQETLLRAAADAGAEVRRGARVRRIVAGQPSRVTVESDAGRTEVRARLVVGADGRASLVREWAGFPVRQDPPHLLVSGLLLDDVSAPDDCAHFVLNPALGQGALLFPQGGGRARAYLVHQHAADRRLQGEGDVAPLLTALVETGGVPEHYAGVRASGPIATFPGAETFVEHPYRDGVALVGDAAATSDPTWGQGLSLTLRDVRVLRDRLLADADWDAAGHAYAAEHDRYYGVAHRVDIWLSEMFYRTGPEADARRERALPLLLADPTRQPDHGIAGPDLPADETVRRRFFAEDQAGG
jgi:2-polyprenyl-6-methoxyphenol hydroxylase-like FAD-dependent oxidoreductase